MLITRAFCDLANGPGGLRLIRRAKWFAVEQRLSALIVGEAVHTDDVADVLEYNNLPSGHRAKLGTLVANTVTTLRAEDYYGGLASLGEGFRMRLPHWIILLDLGDSEGCKHQHDYR
ncbi:hypothetical protein JADG_010120 [Aureobasidium aubasidani]|nr:hypothetical protein JADG_010120 [Aureobasidium pullulans]